MSTDFPIEINPRHVRAFLDKIAADRDLELGKIDGQLREKVGEIRRQAHAEARRLARRLIDETRDRERRERDRYLYRLHSELTRERWVVLDRVRDRVRAEALALAIAQFTGATAADFGGRPLAAADRATHAQVSR